MVHKRVEQADWTHQMSLNCKDRIPLGTDFSKRANQITAPKVIRQRQNSLSPYKVIFKTKSLGTLQALKYEYINGVFYIGVS